MSPQSKLHSGTALRGSAGGSKLEETKVGSGYKAGLGYRQEDEPGDGTAYTNGNLGQRSPKVPVRQLAHQHSRNEEDGPYRFYNNRA